ncbi:hypothetical protein KAR34_02710 [bacterium]|nr:hypothetical protein [bacterium]
MISDEEKEIIIDLAKRYHVKKILLFGSNANALTKGVDIDLAVEGISPEYFFDFYGELLFNLTQPVDVIDLDVENKFTNIIRQEGIPLYG